MAEEHDQRSTNGAVLVTYKPVDIPINVRMEEPSPLMREFMKLPGALTKILAVTIADTFKEFHTYYFPPNIKRVKGKLNDAEVTIRALAKEHHKSKHRIRKALKDGQALTLNYFTQLPYLDPKRGQLRQPVIITDPKIIQEIQKENKKKIKRNKNTRKSLQ